MATKKEAFCKAFVASIPILCSYLFLGMAYGILMQEQGFGWLESLITSAVVYTGRFSVCTHYVFIERRVAADHRGDSAFHEQPPELLRADIS